MVSDRLLQQLMAAPAIADALPRLEAEVEAGHMTAAFAVDELLALGAAG